MIRQKPKLPPENYLRTPSPEPWSREPSVASDWEADDEDTMSMEEARPSPPSSIVLDSDGSSMSGPYHPQRPSLPDVLSNSAPPPWTLSAFTAYLSQNHCLENLEFTLDAERYKEKYELVKKQAGGKPPPTDLDETRHLRMLWQKILDAYIIPDCPREINIPSEVRETLLSLPNKSTPPNPTTLEAAVKIIYNLMEESVLIPFLNEAPPKSKAMNVRQGKNATVEGSRRKRCGSDSSNDSKTISMSRNKSKRRGSPMSSSESVQPADPTGRLTPGSRRGRNTRGRSNTSSTRADSEALTDDSGSMLSSSKEPLTPPQSPPQSDIGESSPKGRPDNSWMKMLGWKKKSSSTHFRDSGF